MYGIGHQNLVVAPWKAMFLICGGLTAMAGVLFFFLMPSGPNTAWFLTQHEQVVASKRLQEESEGGDRTNFSMLQLKEAVCDIRAYLSFLFGVLITLPAPVIGVSSIHFEQFFNRPSLIVSALMAVCVSYYTLPRLLQLRYNAVYIPVRRCADSLRLD